MYMISNILLCRYPAWHKLLFTYVTTAATASAECWPQHAAAVRPTVIMMSRWRRRPLPVLVLLALLLPDSGAAQGLDGGWTQGSATVCKWHVQATE